MAGRGRPILPDYQTLEAMGFKPSFSPKDEMKKVLRLNDEQIHVNRFKWYNLPRGLTGNMIERMLYYRGQVAWFYLPGTDEFAVLPFVLNSSIDIYGRYKAISPIPFNGKNDAEIKTIEDARKSKDLTTVLLSDITANVLYDPVDYEKVIENPDLTFSSAVILSDYTRQLPQQILPKYKLTEQVIDYESRIFPYVSTALSAATGVSGVRVDGQDEQANVELASRLVEFAALNGLKWIPIDGGIDFQELTGGQVAKAEEFLLSMQSMDNFRLGIHGVENGGLFEKKAHTTNYENAVNMGTSGFTLQDALWNRQNWCDIVNSITGYGIWCDLSEVSSGADRNMDAMIGDGAQAEQQPTQSPAQGGTSDADTN